MRPSSGWAPGKRRVGEALPLILGGLALAALGVAFATLAHGLQARREANRYQRAVRKE